MCMSRPTLKAQGVACSLVIVSPPPDLYRCGVLVQLSRLLSHKPAELLAEVLRSICSGDMASAEAA